MTLDDLVAELSQRFEIVDGTPAALSQTGEQYHEFNGHSRPSAEGVDGVGAPSEDGAVRLLREGILHYADGKAGTLYWRIRPEVSISRGKWHCYARLLISDKPVSQ